MLEHKGKTFHIDAPGDAATPESMREFVARVLAGEVRTEYDDWRGLPDRWWLAVVKFMPPLSVLDGVLPRYSCTGLTAIVLAILLYLLMMIEPYPEGHKPAKVD